MLLEVKIRTILVFCILAVLRPVVLVTEEPGHSQNQLVLKEGLNYFYNSDFRSADKKFDEYIALEPEDPVGYWRKAVGLFWEFRFQQGTDTPILTKDRYDEFVALVNLGIGKADVKLARNEQMGFHLYVKAALYTIKAGVEAKNVSWFDAGGSIKTALGLAEQSNYQDAKFLVGIVNYLGAGKNIAIRTALAIYGIPRDRNKGLALVFEAATLNETLEKAHSGVNLFADDVWFGVFSIYIEKRNQNNYGGYAGPLFDYLFSKYPHSENLQEYLKNINKANKK